MYRRREHICRRRTVEALRRALLEGPGVVHNPDVVRGTGSIERGGPVLPDGEVRARVREGGRRARGGRYQGRGLRVGWRRIHRAGDHGRGDGTQARGDGHETGCGEYGQAAQDTRPSAREGHANTPQSEDRGTPTSIAVV